MNIDQFEGLVKEIEGHCVFHSNSHNCQAPVQWQLLIALANLGSAGNGGGPPMLAQFFCISGESCIGLVLSCLLTDLP